MKKRIWIGSVVTLLLLAVLGIYGYRRWSEQRQPSRNDILSLMPSDASAIFFADFSELRQAPFMNKLFAWAPKPTADADYAQFVRDTGFDYERDLDCIAAAVEKHGADSTLFAIAEGKFDPKKLAEYAQKSGSVNKLTDGKSNNNDIYSITIPGNAKQIFFAFLASNRIAVTNDSTLATVLKAKKKNIDNSDWRIRFDRLAGTPIFAVIRQDAGAGAALETQAPGGLHLPQLSALLDQLQWITIAAKPEGDELRVVSEGESPNEMTTHQLADLLNGVVLLAEGGLNDRKNRHELDPKIRQAYLTLLQSAEVSKIDRGETKSVRLVFDLTPDVLEAAYTAKPTEPPPNPALPAHSKNRHHAMHK